LNIEDQFKKSLAEIKDWLEQANEKKTLAIEKAKIEEPIIEIKEVKTPHEIYGQPYPAKVVEQTLPPIPRVIEPEVREVSFCSEEEEQTIQAKPEEKQKLQPVQVTSYRFTEYDHMTYDQLMEAKAKVSEFKTQDERERYDHIIKRIIAIHPTT
jgi:hypothetical protein